MDEESFRAGLYAVLPEQEENVIADLKKRGQDGRRMRSTWPLTPTARVRRSAGISSSYSSQDAPRPRSTGCCSTRSPSGRSSCRLRGARSRSTCTRSRPSRPGGSSTGWWVTRSARCCGTRCAGASPPAGSRASRCGSSVSASARSCSFREQMNTGRWRAQLDRRPATAVLHGQAGLDRRRQEGRDRFQGRGHRGVLAPAWAGKSPRLQSGRGRPPGRRHGNHRSTG